MNLNEAVEKAREQEQPEVIEIGYMEVAKSLIGKSLLSKIASNKNELRIVDWRGQNYIVQVNHTDNFNIIPVMHVLDNLHLMIVNWEN